MDANICIENAKNQYSQIFKTSNFWFGKVDHIKTLQHFKLNWMLTHFAEYYKKYPTFLPIGYINDFF